MRTTPLFFALVAACASGSANPMPFGTRPRDEGASASVTDVQPIMAPPLESSPKDAELTEDFGIFVSAAAAPGGDGSRARPLLAIAEGLLRARQVGKRVYVCAGTYREALWLENGVPVVGGLQCDGTIWRSRQERSTIEAPTSPALRALGITAPTRFEGFDVTAPNGTASEPSSIGLLASDAGGLTIARSRLAAGAGADGANGDEGIKLTLGGSAAGSAGGAWSLAGGVATPRAGGRGGTGACIGEAGHDGESGGAGGSGGIYSCDAYLEDGWYYYFWILSFRDEGEPRSGANGATGRDGPSATTIGALSIDGYLPADGARGGDGMPGRGGAGEAGEVWGAECASWEEGSFAYGRDGSGGGAGGCPGLAGSPGRGGGASIGILVFASPGLTLDATEVVASAGGKGGSGTFGSAPTAGGLAGRRAASAGFGYVSPTAPAGSGGAGGRAGSSGSGAGGPSLAIAESGGAVTLGNDARAIAGAGGAGVPAITKNGSVVAASIDGASVDVYEF